MNKRKGMTLVELICAMACLALLMMVIMSVFKVGVFGGEIGTKEFDQQAAFRVATEKITNQVRYSTALFILPESSFNATNLSGANRDIYLTELWNYFGLVETTVLDSDGNSVAASQVVEYIWDDVSGTHKENVVVPARADMTYELVFSKRNEEDPADKNIEFLVKATNNNTGATYFLVESESQALNSLQVVNWAGGASPGVAIAYRADDRDRGSRGGSGKVLAIVDISGSMYSHQGALRVALTNLVNGLQAKGSIDFAIVPFGFEANLSATYFDNAIFQANGGFSGATCYADILGYTPAGGGPMQYKFFDLTDPDEFKIIKAFASSIAVEGNTNTGDGIRRAYEAFEADASSTLSTMKNYVILLVDGNTNQATIEPYDASNPANIQFRTARGDTNETLIHRWQSYSTTGIAWNPLINDFMLYLTGDSTLYKRTDAIAVNASNPLRVPTNWASTTERTLLGGLDAGNEYVKMNADRITRDFQVNAHIIAYTNGINSSTIQLINDAFSTNGKTATSYAAADADELIAVFDEIMQTIINDPWFIDGPNQVPTPVGP